MLLVAYFLASIARFYHPGSGFTALIGFGDEHEYEILAVQAAPHFHHGHGGGYDGQFYAQLAVDPLLRDASIDRALDSPPYRGRRILFSWTAYALGLGRPAWILQAYALQNVACWLILAWLLTRWVSPDNVRSLALWTACLWSQGLLWSVRLALVDGPSLLLLACAVAASERGHTWKATGILGAAGLARETNLLGIVLLPVPRSRGAFLKLAAALLVAIVPLLVWQDYLWSIYRRGVFAGHDQFTVPFTALARKVSSSVRGAAVEGWRSPHLLALAATVSLTVQAAYVLLRRSWFSPWWRLATAYAVLMLVVHYDVWHGFPGAVTRVVLPLTVGFNVLLAAENRKTFWAWYALGNLQLLYAFDVLRA